MMILPKNVGIGEYTIKNKKRIIRLLVKGVLRVVNVSILSIHVMPVRFSVTSGTFGIRMAIM